MSSINHDPRYHGLPWSSNTFTVLVFSELAVAVRKILQREENKGVELTVHGGNGLREDSSESKRKEKKPFGYRKLAEQGRIKSEKMGSGFSTGKCHGLVS